MRVLTLWERCKKVAPILCRDKDLVLSVGCGEGWHDLVVSLCEDIEYEIEDSGVQTMLLQVKEKFGALRVYVEGETEKIRKLIREAEEKSFEICERCGSSEDVTTKATNGWIKTLCGICREERESL